MKAISIHQPWASLIALGEKHYETRNWKPRHRGPIIIHASKSFSKAEQALLQTEPFKCVCARHGITSITDLPTGRPLAIATLKDAFMVEEITTNLTPTEQAFRDFRQGRCAAELHEKKPTC
jgi:activating signal cointegrator 1